MNVALVNDQALALEMLRRVIVSVPGYRVAWTARDGAAAVAQCARQRPDVILMDLLMPVMDGVEATRKIMASTPCPIIVVTSSVGANSWRAFEAMGHGAVDAVDTPTGSPQSPSARALLEKLSWIARRDGAATTPAASLPGKLPVPGDTQGNLVAIGASAGGPAALATLLGALPRDFAASIVVVQHVDAQFASGMADWLNRTSPLTVRVARVGDRPAPSTVLLAGTNDHLILRDTAALGYTVEPRDQVYRPSIDVFFNSVASGWPGRVVGVLLTGMGRDGAIGLKVLRNQGHLTLAQDEASSAVYGMPKAAAQLDAAAEILPLSRIAGRLLQVVDSRS